MNELEPLEVDYGWQQTTGEYENINTWCFKGNPSPKDHTTLRSSAFYDRRRAEHISPGPTGISSSGSSYSSVLIRPGVYRRKPAEPSTLRFTRVSSRASRGPRRCKLQTRQRAESVRSVHKCLHVASSQFVSAGDKLKFLLVTYRNTTLIWKYTRICYCNIHLFVTHFNQKNSLTCLLHS